MRGPRPHEDRRKEGQGRLKLAWSEKLQKPPLSEELDLPLP